jgi:malonate decarboxylase delta subunit
MSGMESLSYEFAGTQRLQPFAPVLVGVVASGNLEVLIEPTTSDQSTFHIQTSARGFGAIWEAVLHDFQDRYRYTGLSVSINDMGATPAVVSLRLDQAAASLQRATT